MSCTPFHELLTAGLDDELSPQEQAQLDQHLADCSACRDLQERLKRMESGFAHLPEAAPPPLRPRPAVTPLPAKTGSAAAATAIWGVLLAAAACAAVTLWSPTRAGGSALYLSSHQLQYQHPQEEALAVSEFRSPPLRGKAVVHGQLSFEIHLDSDSHPCKDLQLEVDYDFDGDGAVDRSETYASFNTDDRDGWEVYAHNQGPLRQQGEMRDFTGGTVACRLKNASGAVQVLQGNSKLVLPHHITV